MVLPRFRYSGKLISYDKAINKFIVNETQATGCATVFCNLKGEKLRPIDLNPARFILSPNIITIHMRTDYGYYTVAKITGKINDQYFLGEHLAITKIKYRDYLDDNWQDRIPKRYRNAIMTAYHGCDPQAQSWPMYAANKLYVIK